jgi:hypothetical protein
MLSKLLPTYGAFSFILLWNFLTYGQCKVIKQENFSPQNKTVKLIATPNNSRNFVFFQTSLRVNTDGAPNSYHPDDLSGTTMAINNICNGVAIYRQGSKVPLSCAETKKVFAQFRDDNWIVPKGYKINWQNVIASKENKPCVFQMGEFKGYFGSLTSLKNDLSGIANGECECKNQLDQRIIPAFVMPRGKDSVLTRFGVGLGDLLFVYNPQNKLASVAIVGDTGPANKLGEGSVGLNMALLGECQQPKTYKEALKLDTGNRDMLIAIIPGTRNYKLQKPYTKENIIERVNAWIIEAGFENNEKFIECLQSCSSFK